MTICIYCGINTAHEELTLEHVIPQSLGGAYAPDNFKIKVCKKCNSNMGLFVDAAFEKNWLVSMWLSQTAKAFFDPKEPSGLPLACIGIADLAVPGLTNDEICESWLGPLGEQIFWVRPKDERLSAYVGGNPRTTKQKPTRAYFLYSERSFKNVKLSWLCFQDAFSNRKKVKKIMCTHVEGADPADIGFKIPDELDRQRIEFFKSATRTQNSTPRKIPFSSNFDHRFIAKLGLGISYSLFGEKILDTIYTAELRKGLWYQEGDDMPKILGMGPFHPHADKNFPQMFGHEHAITFMVQTVAKGVVINLTIGTKMTWVAMCADYDGIDLSKFRNLKDGVVVVIFKPIQRAVSLSLPEYLAHKLAAQMNNELADIERRIKNLSGYFENL